MAAACRGPLPGHGTGAGGRADAGAPFAPRLRFEPPPSVDGAEAITQLTLELDTVPDGVEVLLVEGELTAAQLRDLARPVLPATLAARAVDALAWVDGNTIAVAPSSALAPGALYTLGVSLPPLALPFQVAPASANPVLRRVWPAGVASFAAVAVWCGPTDVPPAPIAMALPPAGLVGHFERGSGSSIPVAHCITWVSVAEEAASLPAVSPPALVYDDGTSLELEPLIFDPGSASPASGLPCADAEIAFSRGCAAIEDDRALVRAPDEPLLWTVDAGREAEVRASRAAERFVLRPLPSSLRYRVATLDAAGNVDEADISVVPAAPRSHVVLNEVLANPAGAEPAQEWIELYNDGTEAQSLAGYTVDDGATRTALPEAELGAGAFALVVADAYVADDGVDPAAAPATLLLHVRSLGQGGLSNEGERLTLRDAAGAAISSFPPLKTKNGVSIARLAPEALDDDPASFGASPNGAATPGSANGGP
jgi:hypothetical protein